MSKYLGAVIMWLFTSVAVADTVPKELVEIYKAQYLKKIEIIQGDILVSLEHPNITDQIYWYSALGICEFKWHDGAQLAKYQSLIILNDNMEQGWKLNRPAEYCDKIESMTPPDARQTLKKFSTSFSVFVKR